MKLLEH